MVVLAVLMIRVAIAEDAYRDQVNDLAYSAKFDLDDFYKQLKVRRAANALLLALGRIFR